MWQPGDRQFWQAFLARRQNGLRGIEREPSHVSSNHDAVFQMPIAQLP
jgi:hypothetical protein